MLWCAIIGILSSLNAYPATPDPIDWDYYKSKLSTKSALVDSFKKQVIYIFGKVIAPSQVAR